MIHSSIAIILGFLLDMILGDPRGVYHPVQLIGLLITTLEKGLRRVFPATKTGERIAGSILAILVVACTIAVSWLLLFCAYRVSFWLGLLLETVMCYQILATKSLKTESMKVYAQLKQQDLAGARYAVSMIVGRDTDALDEQGITKATVETIAENTADGSIAPLFYLLLGGPIWGFAYKAINTLDSMIGYRNATYRYFGTLGARLDDLANFIPARLCALVMLLACRWGGLHVKHAWKMFKRDRYQHKSPNSAQTESVMAGALGVQLAGDAIYFGKVVKKPTIGDALRPIQIEDIKTANRLLYTTAWLTFGFGIILKLLIVWIS